MNTRLYNARILTMDNGCDFIEGEIHVENNRITYVGGHLSDKDKSNLKVTFDREIDCLGNVLMPGFKDAHTHSAMTGMRSLADDMPLAEWLNTKIFPLEAKLTDEDIYVLTQLSVLEYLTTGITAVFDMYLSPYESARACEEMGLRMVNVSGINKFGPTLEVMEKRYNDLNKNNGFSSYMMGFHAEYTCTKELLSDICSLAKKYDAPIWAHNSETKSEVDECIGRYGLTPTELMESLGMFENGGGGYHCVYLSDNDIEIFKKHNLTVVTNPGSNAKLASGVAPVSRYVKEGINVAIGTDGPSSNNALDMFREMYLVTALAKLHDEDASAMRPIEVLKMATVNGARCMQLDDCDLLREGKKADIIMIDLHQPNMQPINNIVDNIVYSGSKSNIKMTMIDGKILYEDGCFNVGVDAEEIYKKANEVMAKYKD